MATLAKSKLLEKYVKRMLPQNTGHPQKNSVRGATGTPQIKAVTCGFETIYSQQLHEGIYQQMLLYESSHGPHS